MEAVIETQPLPTVCLSHRIVYLDTDFSQYLDIQMQRNREMQSVV